MTTPQWTVDDNNEDDEGAYLSWDGMALTVLELTAEDDGDEVDWPTYSLGDPPYAALVADVAAARLVDDMAAVVRGVLTVCRECRDEAPPFSTNVPMADFIVWGKLNPPEALGPKCHDHAVKHLGHAVGYRSAGHAVVDLRPLRAVLAKVGDVAALHHARRQEADAKLWCGRCEREVTPDEAHEANPIGGNQGWWFHTCGDAIGLRGVLPTGTDLREHVAAALHHARPQEQT